MNIYDIINHYYIQVKVIINKLNIFKKKKKKLTQGFVLNIVFR